MRHGTGANHIFLFRSFRYITWRAVNFTIRRIVPVHSIFQRHFSFSSRAFREAYFWNLSMFIYRKQLSKWLLYSVAPIDKINLDLRLIDLGVFRSLCPSIFISRENFECSLFVPSHVLSAESSLGSSPFFNGDSFSKLPNVRVCLWVSSWLDSLCVDAAWISLLRALSTYFLLDERGFLDDTPERL